MSSLALAETQSSSQAGLAPPTKAAETAFRRLVRLLQVPSSSDHDTSAAGVVAVLILAVLRPLLVMFGLDPNITQNTHNR